MENFIILLILAAIVGCITVYLLLARKKGGKCIGCPYGKSCASKCGCSERPEKKS